MRVRDCLANSLTVRELKSSEGRVEPPRVLVEAPEGVVEALSSSRR